MMRLEEIDDPFGDVEALISTGRILATKNGLNIGNAVVIEGLKMGPSGIACARVQTDFGNICLFTEAEIRQQFFITTMVRDIAARRDQQVKLLEKKHHVG